MANKEDFVMSLLQDTLEEAIFSRTIPELPTVIPGTDLDSSAIAISQYCANMNQFLKIFEGVPLLEYLLRGMQRTPQLTALAMASLIKVAGGQYIRIIDPQNFLTYYGYVPLYCYASSMVTTIEVGGWGHEEIYLERATGFRRNIPINQGEYSLAFQGYDAENNAQGEEKVVTAQVLPFATFPIDDYHIQAPWSDYAIVWTEGATDEISTGVLMVNGDDEYFMHKETGYWVTDDPVGLEIGVQSLDWEVVTEEWELSIKWATSVTIEEGE